MSESTTNTETKQFLDTVGLNTLWNKICNVFAPISHNHDNVYKLLQAPVADPNVEDKPAISFISTIKQDTNGVISATKRIVPTMTGATNSSDGTKGLVPAPSIGKRTSFLKGDGSWALPENATTTESGFMSAEDKTKLDKIQDFYEVSVDLSRYTVETSLSTNLSATAQDVRAFNIGDKIRIKSSLDFPTDQLPRQVRVHTPGFDIISYVMGPDGEYIRQLIGVLRWSTADDTEALNALSMYYNDTYINPNKYILKYGGYIDVIIINIAAGTGSSTEYTCAPLFNNSCGYITTNAVNATNAVITDTVKISTSSMNSLYPLVFTNNVTTENKSLYIDSANSLHYNPNTDTLTIPNVNASNVAVKGTMNFKGTDHNNEVLSISGGSSNLAPSITIRTKNNQNYLGISMLGKADTSTPAEIRVYGNSETSNPSYTYIQGGRNPVVTSDERLKDFGDNVEVDFNELKKIPKKYFTWKNDNIKLSNIGTSAQSIEKLYPELVITDDNGYKSLDYSTLSIIALAAIDKLNERIEYLENKLKEYEQA